MRTIVTGLLLAFCTPAFASDAVLLQWHFSSNESFYIDKFTVQSILRDGELVRRYSIKELSVLALAARQGGNQFLTGIYRSYERNLLLTNGPWKLTTEYPLFFAVSNNGALTVPDNADLPNIRDLPCFPLRPASVGETWRHSASETFLFEPPIRVPFEVEYRYAARETKDGIDCARIDFSYRLDYANPGSAMDVPARFGGQSRFSLWYDVAAGAPWYLESSYDIILAYPEGTEIEYKGDLYGHYYRHRRYTGRDRAVLLGSVRKALRSLKQGVTINTDSRGIVISLNEIFFDFDSSRIGADAAKKLALIGSVLKKNPGFEVIVEGHTDDTGDEDYNQRLSERRAAAALDWFMRDGAVAPGRGSFAGKGESEPAWPNDGEANRRKNRRVDIIIRQE